MSQVREEDISNLQIFSGGWLGHDDAAQLLRIYSHNVETALNKVLDAGPEGVGELLRQQNTGWDNTAFGADRYGNNEATGSIPTFNIEYAPGVDNYPHSGGPSGAPTRPSSRTSQRSGVSAHAGDTPWQSVESGQESGVIGGSGTYGPVFGPATREHYEANSWALVPATKSTEYIPDAAMSFQSRHDSGAPAFIKPVPNPDRLPEALTILHSIPLFRNALLAPQISNNNYWLGSDWWKGQPSTLARTVDGSSASEAANELDLIYETQRLVAFLDDSDRSYANIESMYQLDIWKQQTRVSPEEPDDLNDDLLKFLLRWNWAYERHAPELALDGVFQSTINVGGQHNKSFLLDAEVQPCKESEQRNLYDILDLHLFNVDAGRAHIVQPSDVLILRLNSTKDSVDLDCQIPDTFYADRYLEDNRSPVDEIYDQIAGYNKQQTTIDTAVEGLKFHTPQKVEYPRKMDALTLLKTSMKAFEPEDDGVQQNPKYAAVLAQLQSIHQNIERKLSSLEEEKKKISDAVDGIWAEFRAPLNKPDEVESTSKHKFNYPYKLCGLATSSSDTYNLYLDGKSGKSVAKGWWHIKYHITGDEASISREQVALDDVLQTCLKTSKALLIYANDAATSVSPVELSKPLKNFVQKDNFNLLQELSEQKRDWQDSKPDEGATVVGTWDVQDPDPPDYTDDWNTISAKDFYQGDSGVSSTTLTPNTEMDDDGVGMEMQEVNGGINAWAGISNVSSDTVGEPMDVSETQATVNIRDVEMSEAETPANVEPRVEHIEVVEKKGG